MKEPRTLLLKATTLRGLFVFLKQSLRISAKQTYKIIEREPRMVYQNHHESIRKKVAMLAEVHASRMVQQGVLKRAPSFYLM